MEAEERTCPECAETIKALAKVCKHCGAKVEPIAAKPADVHKPETSAGLSWAKRVFANDLNSPEESSSRAEPLKDIEKQEIQSTSQPQTSGIAQMALILLGLAVVAAMVVFIAQGIDSNEVASRSPESKIAFEPSDAEAEADNAMKAALAAQAKARDAQAALDREAYSQSAGAAGAAGRSASDAPTAANIDRLTTFAVMSGRAAGCGMPTAKIGKEIGEWIDRHFPPGSKAQQTYLPIYSMGVSKNADDQAQGNSPDSCDAVAAFFNSPEFKRAVAS